MLITLINTTSLINKQYNVYKYSSHMLLSYMYTIRYGTATGPHPRSGPFNRTDDVIYSTTQCIHIRLPCVYIKILKLFTECSAQRISKSVRIMISIFHSLHVPELVVYITYSIMIIKPPKLLRNQYQCYSQIFTEGKVSQQRIEFRQLTSTHVRRQNIKAASWRPETLFLSRFIFLLWFYEGQCTIAMLYWLALSIDLLLLVFEKQKN